ncbi:MAG: prephenate dehydrogenase/arogenate dehydrogenase family protein [Gemmatimonadales bacterium]
MNEKRLDELRRQLAQLDILTAAAARRHIAQEIGRIKGTLGRPTRDFGQEREVMQRARNHAVELGVPVDTCDRIMLELIASSLQVQERDKVSAFGVGDGRRVLIIGGAGRMGRWFARFLASQGFDVAVADPNGSVDGCTNHEDWTALDLDHDLIIVAAPLRPTANIINRLADARPQGVVCDIGSLKTPLKDALLRLHDAGVKVASIHPMFGPDTELLSGRHVIVVDVGSDEATAVARELFAATMVTMVEMNIEEHDRVIAYILGLSHALNLAFFTALGDSGESVPHLSELSSTTFDSQLAIAQQVASENPYLYYEIQALNEFGQEVLDNLRRATDRIASVVAAQDETQFVRLMDQGRKMFD